MYEIDFNSITQEILHRPGYDWILKTMIQLNTIKEKLGKEDKNDLYALGIILNEVLDLDDLPEDFRESVMECHEELKEWIREVECSDSESYWAGA